MKYLLRDLFHDIIDEARELGIWHDLTLYEQAELVGHLLREYGSILQKAKNAEPPQPADRAAA